MALRGASLPLVAMVLIGSLAMGGVGAGASGGVSAGPGAGPPIPLSNNTTVIHLMVTDQFAFVPNVLSSPSLKVEFVIENAGTIDHTFTLSDRVNATAPSNATASTAPGQWFESSHLYANVPVNASTSGGTNYVYVNVTFRQVGYYQFICIPHYALGMKGLVYVGEAAPSSSSSVNPLQYGFVYIIVIISALVAVVIVMALIVGKRGAAHAGPTHGKSRDEVITSRVDYYNDSRPSPYESDEAPEAWDEDRNPPSA
jgi:plastocyanin